MLDLINDRAGGRTDVEVWPDDQMAAVAGLEYRGSELYDAAIRWLLKEGVLQRVPETNAALSRAVGTSDQGDAFKITDRGKDLLQQHS